MGEESFIFDRRTGRLLEVVPPTPEIRFYCGLDLGQSKDFTALTVLERHGEPPEATFHVRFLKRFALGTSYPSIVESVAEMLNRPPLAGSEPKPSLAVDQTGVGRPVVDMIHRANLAASVWPATITAGHEESGDRVPKRVLVALAQVALQTGRLKIAPSLPEAQTLVNELQNFRVKISDAGHDSYESWRESDHDDLCFAVMLALWVGSKRRGGVVRWDI